MVGSTSTPWRSIGFVAIRTGCHSHIFYGDIQDTRRGVEPNREHYATLLLTGDVTI